MADCS